MENNGLKISRGNTEHLKTTGDTNPVRMKICMETEMVNLPSVSPSNILDQRHQRRGVQSGKGMVEMGEN